MSARVIGVNLTWLVPGVVGGSEEYTVRLLSAVGTELPDDLRLRLYGSQALLDAHPTLAEDHEFVVAPVFPGGRAGRVVMEATWLTWQARADDVVHHCGGTVPLVRSRPSMVTIFDLQPIEVPENFSAVKGRWLRFSLPRAAKAAKMVVCLSDHTAGQLAVWLGVDRAKVRVVPYGLPASSVGPKSDAEVAGLAEESDAEVPGLAEESSPSDGAGIVSSKPWPTGRFLLYPAITYPHKRHRDLLDLLDQMGPRFGDVSLVLTGRPGPESGSLSDVAAELGLTDRVQALGRVSADELAELYRSAAALVFPSGYEGFGLPVLEAMSAGCPVITSDAGALPEVVGDGGLVHPVGDVGAMTQLVTKVLDQPDVAGALRQRGQARAKDFDLDIAAQRLADVYREAVALTD